MFKRLIVISLDCLTNYRRNFSFIKSKVTISLRSAPRKGRSSSAINVQLNRLNKRALIWVWNHLTCLSELTLASLPYDKSASRSQISSSDKGMAVTIIALWQTDFGLAYSTLDIIINGDALLESVLCLYKLEGSNKIFPRHERFFSILVDSVAFVLPCFEHLPKLYSDLSVNVLSSWPDQICVDPKVQLWLQPQI